MFKYAITGLLLSLCSCGDDPTPWFPVKEPDAGKTIVWELCPDRDFGRAFSCTKEPLSIDKAQCCTFIDDDEDVVCRRGLYKCPLKVR